MRPRTMVIALLVVLLLFAPKVITGFVDSAGTATKQTMCGAVR
jgi:Sec-independent protein translocase protein TatA